MLCADPALCVRAEVTREVTFKLSVEFQKDPATQR